MQEKVKERVRVQLIAQIPNNLRQEINSNKRQILQVKTTIHNSEARRKNSRVETKTSESLSPLLRPSLTTAQELEPPTPSPLFPKSIPKLLDLPPDALRKLAEDYDLVDSSSPVVPVGDTVQSAEAHQKLLNKVMDHIGISFLALPSALGERPLLSRKPVRTD